eukprot:5886318-Amphidinium_carterae.1
MEKASAYGAGDCRFESYWVVEGADLKDKFPCCSFKNKKLAAPWSSQAVPHPLGRMVLEDCQG